MGALEFRHRQNIIYREDTLESRLSILERWKNEGTIELDEYNELLKDCTNEQVVIDNERKYGIKKSTYLNKNNTKKDLNSKITTEYAKDLAIQDMGTPIQQNAYICGYMKSVEKTNVKELFDALINLRKWAISRGIDIDGKLLIDTDKAIEKSTQ